MPRKKKAPEPTFQEHIADFLVRVPHRDAEDDKPERPAFTLFPRYHQSRSVRKVADDISAQFAAKGDIGRKYLVNHSAGSGKTLTMCWLADRLHKTDEPDAEAPELDPEEQLAKIIREHDLNQMIVVFTATPLPATVTLSSTKKATIVFLKTGCCNYFHALRVKDTNIEKESLMGSQNEKSRSRASGSHPLGAAVLANNLKLIPRIPAL